MFHTRKKINPQYCYDKVTHIRVIIEDLQTTRGQQSEVKINDLTVLQFGVFALTVELDNFIAEQHFNIVGLEEFSGSQVDLVGLDRHGLAQLWAVVGQPVFFARHHDATCEQNVN